MSAVNQYNVSPLIINEFLASNGDDLEDEDDDYSDWVEIYNQSTHPVQLGDWALTDGATAKDKWIFPDITLDAHAYLLVFASGKNRKPTSLDSPLHTNFTLNMEGEALTLYNIKNPRLKDILNLENLPQLRNISYGRYGEGVYGYFTNPTPNKTNDSINVWQGISAKVEFSVERGFYYEPFTVTLSTATPESIIRYTTDGSQPGESNGKVYVYTTPILITATTNLRAATFKETYITAYHNTHSYIFLDEVILQSGMDPELITNKTRQVQIQKALKSIPTFLLTTADDSYYIYAQAWERGPLWERPVSVEYIIPNNLTDTLSYGKGFQINAGMRMHGGIGRYQNKKISLRLFFRGRYGQARLEYPLFPESPINSFDTLILRAGGNRNYTGDPEEALETTYTRDEWLRLSQIALSNIAPHGQFIHLYLNGHYWGLYSIVERPDENFLASYFGGAEGDWYSKSPDRSNGSSKRYKKLEALVDENDLQNPSKYIEIQEYLNITDFIDYMILNWYAGNQDWPHINWYLGLKNDPSGQIQYFTWDGEKIWPGQGANIYWGHEKHADKNHIAPLFKALAQNQDFRMTLADRLYKNLFNQGPLTEENSQKRWQAINDSIDQAIEAEIARWGVIKEVEVIEGGWIKKDGHFLQQIVTVTNRWLSLKPNDKVVTKADWLNTTAQIQRQMKDNGDRLIAIARESGYYPLLDPPVFSQTEETSSQNIILSLTAAEGSVYYTIDGSDPRETITGKVSPTAIAYQGPLTLAETAHIKARVRADGAWSALTESTFYADTKPNRLIINEIMYNPLGDDAYEFLELKNVGEIAFDASGIYFEGIGFEFPDGTILQAGELVVLVKNSKAFAEKYPNVKIDGVYTKKLSNNGEVITLKDTFAREIFTVHYKDEAGWPISADGHGDSLENINPLGNPNTPTNWQPSALLYGSPGK